MEETKDHSRQAAAYLRRLADQMEAGEFETWDLSFENATGDASKPGDVCRRTLPTGETKITLKATDKKLAAEFRKACVEARTEWEPWRKEDHLPRVG
jgi:hypothetical protein